MLLSRSLFVLPLAVLLFATQGCSTSTTSTGDSYQAAPEKNAIKEYRSTASDGVSRETRKNHSTYHSHQQLTEDISYNTSGLNRQRIQRLNRAKAAFTTAYYSSSIDDLPYAEDLIFGSYASMHPDKAHVLAKKYPQSHGNLSVFDDPEGIIKAMRRVTEDLQQNNSQQPSISKQNVLCRTSDHLWRIHYQFMANIRKHLKGEYRFNELDDNSPTVADATVYRLGPFIAWSNEHWSVDSMLTYGWINMETETRRRSGAPKGSEWGGHMQLTYTVPLDSITMGLKLVPEAYAGYRAGNIDAHDEKNDQLTRHILSSKQTGLTTRIGSGIRYTCPDLKNPVDLMLRAGLEKAFMWQEDEQDRNSHWPKTPTPESRETAIYYGLGLNHQFGASLDKLIGLDYMGTSGKKSGSDALTLSYRQRF